MGRLLSRNSEKLRRLAIPVQAFRIELFAISCRLGAKPAKLQGGGAKGGYYVFFPGDGEQLTTPRRTPFFALVSFETLAAVRHV